MSMSFRCRYCTDDRYPGCHATCPKYKEDREKYDKRKAAHEVERGLNDYQLGLICKGADKRAKVYRSHAGIVKPTGK